MWPSTPAAKTCFALSLVALQPFSQCWTRYATATTHEPGIARFCIQPDSRQSFFDFVVHVLILQLKTMSVNHTPHRGCAPGRQAPDAGADGCDSPEKLPAPRSNPPWSPVRSGQATRA